MPTEQYHEPPDELTEEIRTSARICTSLIEEAEAINWYEQRLSLETDLPVTLCLSQVDNQPEHWREVLGWIHEARAAGADLVPQVAGRPLGLLLGLTTKHQFTGRPTYDGRLTAEQILHGWRLDADLVTLSACETGLGKFSEGEGYLGFSQALFVAGARSLMLSLWQVDDASTALLMTRFYENLLARRPGLKKPMTKAEALAEAKAWLRGLKAEEVQQVAGGLVRGLDTETARGKRVAQPANQLGPAARPYPYAHPYYWAGFIMLGDPN